jgi:hypothetical protein
MYTYGYLREAVMAHCDLEEDELQAMNVLKRLHIYANEAMQAICACKPNYKYFKVNIVNKYKPIAKLIINNETVYKDYYETISNSTGSIDKINEAAIDEKYENKVLFEKSSETYWILVRNNGTLNWQKIILADELITNKYYKDRNVYLINEEIKMPDEFIAFTNKQTFIVKRHERFNYEDFVNGRDWTTNEAERLEPVNYNKDIMFVGQNKIMCFKVGEFMIPYKCTWLNFSDNLADTDILDIPVDILNCLPLYIASEVLQIDYAQKAQIKRSEFEMALSRIVVTNNMPVNRIKPSF